MALTHSKYAPGWTHIWDGTEQFAISDDLAAFLVLADKIEYSPEDGPNARVYRPLVPLAKIKAMLAS